MKENPTAADIMEEVRQGLADTSLSDATQANLAQNTSLQSHLRQAHEHAPVLGRSGGSLRGKCCRLLAPLAKPVIEQLDLFHHTVLRVIELVAGTQAEAKSKLQNLEERLQKLESKEQPPRET